uniref:Uncharacterized protein n=1 Tax=Oryza brachyantha TaxID=4533 RepID=J3KWZ8_ORYBR
MEPEAVASLRQHGVDIVPVGPVLSFLDAAGAGVAKNGTAASCNDLFKQDDTGYLEWLDAQPAGSVVYISFGSMSTMSRRQIAEAVRAKAAAWKEKARAAAAVGGSSEKSLREFVGKARAN